MAKADANGIQLHYHHFGEGPDVVMLHGLTGNLAIWHLAIVPALSSAFRITTYDQRGHGYSDMPPTGYTTADHATDLKHLLDVIGIDRAHLVGHSFGADIALHFAVLFPHRVERLVLVEPVIPALLPLRMRKDWIGWKYWRDKLALGGVPVPEEKWYDPEYLVRASVSMPMLFGMRKGRPRRSGPLIRLADTTTAAKDYCNPAGMTLDKISEIRHHALLLYGEDSVFVSTYDYLRKNLVNATCVMMPGTEHFGPIENPDLLLDHMREFLSARDRVQNDGEPGRIVVESEPHSRALSCDNSA